MIQQKDVLGNMISESSELKLKIKKLHEDAIIPTRATEDSAGLDMYALEDYSIEAQHSEMIHTGIAMEIPKGYVGLLFVRSGLASKQHLRPSNCVGVIDADYRGEVMLSLYNDRPTHSYTGECNVIELDCSYTRRQIKKGERVAQIVLLPYIAPKTVEVDELSNTERSTRGFGSTGMN